MDIILNQIAPLLVQLLGAIVLALASAALLKGRAWMDARLSVEQRTFLAQLAATAVHLAEVEGAGQVGAQKAAAARRYVDGELMAHGITTVQSGDIEATIIGAVEGAYKAEIGPTYLPPAPVVVMSTEPPAGTPIGIPNSDGTYPAVPNLTPDIGATTTV